MKMRYVLALFLFILAFSSLPICVNAQIPFYIPLTGLKAWYPFSGNMNDSSGYGANGVIYGTVSYGVDRHGWANKCYYSNAAGGVDIPSVNLPVGNHARSVSVWYKSVIPYPGGPRMFVCWGNNGGLGQRFGIFAIDTAIGLEYINGSVTIHFNQDSAWHNLIVTYPVSGSGSSSVIVYRDGYVQPMSIAAPISSFNTDTGTIHCIGKLFPAFSTFYSWKGKIDDIGIWDRALTPCEAYKIAKDGDTSLEGTVSGSRIICAGAVSSLSSTASSGTWTSSATSVATISSTGTIYAVSSGTSIISFTGTTPCGPASDTFEITVAPATSVATITGGSTTLCAGASTSFTGSPSGGTWTSSNPLVASINSSTGVATGGSSGNTIISYSVSNSCGTLIDTQMITVMALPTAGLISGPATICQGSTAVFGTTVSGGAWSSSVSSVASINASTGTAGGVASGSTIISYTVSNSCGTAADTQMISVIALPGAGIVSGPSSICVGAIGVFSSTASGGTWTSSSPFVASINSSSGSSGGASAGSSIISYTVVNACGSAVDTQLVTVIPLPSAGTISGPAFLCPGSTGTFTSGIPGGSWTSSNLSVATVNSSSGLCGGIVAGTSIISYTVSNACGSATDTQLLSVSTIPYAGAIAGPTSVCVGAAISFTGVLSGGTWSSSNPGVATVASGLSGGVGGGTAIISYTLTNSCGTATDTQMITVLPLPSAGNITGPLRVCIGAAITLSSSSPGGAWSSLSPSVATVGSLSGVAGGVSAGTSLISYSVSSICGTVADTQTITVLPLPDAGTIVSSGAFVCLGGSISVSDATAGGGWSSGTPAVATVDGFGIITPVSAGTTTITYTITDDNGCKNQATLLVTIPVISPVTVNADIKAIKCNGDKNGAIDVTATGGTGPYTYVWSDGSGTSSISGLGAGSYTVEVTDAGSGCKDTGVYTLGMPGVMTPELLIESDRCNEGKGSVTIVNVSGGVSPFTYLWSTGSTASSIAAVSSGSYDVTITDANLCTIHYNVIVTEDSCDIVTVHNVITPNGDGYNDFWMVDGISNYPASEVKVFDKWGDEVYSVTGYTNNWNGDKVPDGTYYYLIKYDDKMLKGSLLIKR